jgi:hypothetical protein
VTQPRHPRELSPLFAAHAACRIARLPYLLIRLLNGGHATLGSAYRDRLRAVPFVFILRCTKTAELIESPPPRKHMR